jgi:alpha-amylase
VYKKQTMPNLSGVSLGISDGTVMVDLLGGDTYTVSSGQIGLDLPAMTGAILVARKTSDVPVTFTVNGYVTQFGEDIYVVGSVPELGYWDPDKAVPLTWVDSDTWSGDVLFTDFTNGDGIEYKYSVKSGGQVPWEADPNHSYTVPSTGTGSATDNWQQ